MSKKSIKLLKTAHQNYDLNVEVVSGPQNVSTVKAFITIFENGEKGSIIKKKATAYGSSSASLKAAQDAAVDEAVKNLGL